MSRPIQFKLSALFVLVLVISLPLGGIAYLRHQAADFDLAAAPFEKLTGRRIQASGDGMSVVVGRHGLTQLNLTDADLDDDKLLALQCDLERLPALRWLSLARTAVGDDGLAALRNLHSLRSLSLNGTRVTDAGVKELQRALPKCEIRD